MKKYVIKDTITNIETGHQEICYTGVDRYVHDDPMYADGYSKRGFAERKIKIEIDTFYHFKRIDEFIAIESNTWVHRYEIVEIDQQYPTPCHHLWDDGIMVDITPKGK